MRKEICRRVKNFFPTTILSPCGPGLGITLLYLLYCFTATANLRNNLLLLPQITFSLLRLNPNFSFLSQNVSVNNGKQALDYNVTDFQSAENENTLKRKLWKWLREAKMERMHAYIKSPELGRTKLLWAKI